VAGEGSYRAALADRPLRRVLAIALGVAAAGYGVYGVGPSLLALTAGDPGALAWVGTVNGLTVAAGLPLALRFGARRPPYPAILLAVVAWSIAWALGLGQAYGAGPGVRIVLPVMAALVAIGELLLASALPTLVNALAPEALRGRYNALLTIAMTVGVWVAPLLAAAGAASGHPGLLFAAALAILGVVARLAGGRR
jgi:MFS family permease